MYRFTISTTGKKGSRKRDVGQAMVFTRTCHACTRTNIFRRGETYRAYLSFTYQVLNNERRFHENVLFPSASNRCGSDRLIQISIIFSFATAAWPLSLVIIRNNQNIRTRNSHFSRNVNLNQ